MKKWRLISDMAVMILLIIMISLLEHHFVECTGNYICFYYDRNSETPAITINKLIERQNKYSLKNIAFTSECRECTIKDIAVTPVLTNEYITNTELELIHGSGITAEDIANKNSVMIISEQLALSLVLLISIQSHARPVRRRESGFCKCNCRSFLQQIITKG